MVQSADFIDCYDHAMLHNLPLNRTLFVEREMWARSVIVAEICGQRPFQMTSIKHNEVIQALPTYRSDQSFDMCVLPRALRRCHYLRYAHRLEPPACRISIDADLNRELESLFHEQLVELAQLLMPELKGRQPETD